MARTGPCSRPLLRLHRAAGLRLTLTGPPRGSRPGRWCSSRRALGALPALGLRLGRRRRLVARPALRRRRRVRPGRRRRLLAPAGLRCSRRRRRGDLGGCQSGAVLALLRPRRLWTWAGQETAPSFRGHRRDRLRARRGRHLLRVRRPPPRSARDFRLSAKGGQRAVRTAGDRRPICQHRALARRPSKVWRMRSTPTRRRAP